MQKVSIVLPDDGERLHVGHATDMRVLEDGTTTGHRLGLTESRLGPGSERPPQHRHPAHDEAFYVVSGLVTFTVGADDIEAPAGTLVMVPPGAPHTFGNRSDADAVLLTAFSDARYIGFFRDITTAAGPDEVLDLRARYGTVITDEYAS
jgi:quercetin dioxygenase-like cupin family protein